ncbi:MAG: hypothetical protein ABIK84_02565, partial [candidate division WOR-3 bacterium]
ETTKVESIYTWANDKGLFYSYEDKDVINGLEYYYAVTAFDYNFMRGERLVLEAGIQEKMAIPRKEAANYLAPEAEIEQVRGDKDNTRAKFEILKTNPKEVRDEEYLLHFISPAYDTLLKGPIYRALLTKKNDTILLLDTIRLFYDTTGKIRTYNIPYFFGIEPKLTFELDSAINPFDSIKVKGLYPVETLKVVSVAPLMWAFRGSDYKLVWKRVGDSLTLEVYDLTNDTLVNYTPLSGYTGNRIKDGDGWAFQYGPTATPSPTLRINEKAIYLPGGYIKFRAGGGDTLTRYLYSLIQPGDTWYVYSNKSYGCALSYTKWEIKTKAAIIDTLTKKEFKVKVVPNPYIVTNQWEKTTLSRKIAFTGLPNKCKIRIYNMAGDLVKIIEHESKDFGGTATWNLLNTHDQKIASGVYIFYVESPIGEYVGKFAVVY